jgi:DNA-directed RNA polymerase subunit RPC12/RpoP
MRWGGSPYTCDNCKEGLETRYQRLTDNKWTNIHCMDCSRRNVTQDDVQFRDWLECSYDKWRKINEVHK